MASDSRLLSIEINPQLCAEVCRIRDHRLIPHLGDAADQKEAISAYGLSSPEVIISGIPFSTMSRPTVSELLETIMLLLAPEGRLVLYQVSKHATFQRSQAFLDPATVEARLVLLNLPPLWVLRWQKSCNHEAP
jgi:phospholipid N-methyltransferase